MQSVRSSSLFRSHSRLFIQSRISTQYPSVFPHHLATSRPYSRSPPTFASEVSHQKSFNVKMTSNPPGYVHNLPGVVPNHLLTTIQKLLLPGCPYFPIGTYLYFQHETNPDPQVKHEGEATGKLEKIGDSTSPSLLLPFPLPHTIPHPSPPPQPPLTTPRSRNLHRAPERVQLNRHPPDHRRDRPQVHQRAAHRRPIRRQRLPRPDAGPLPRRPDPTQPPR